MLGRDRNPPELLEEVVSMRRRMFSDGQGRLQGGPETFDIKRDAGGIVDIEFIVQYLVLRFARDKPELARWTDVVNLLSALAEQHLLSEEDADTLRAAYLAYRAEVHRAVLEDVEPLGDRLVFAAQLEQVIRVRDRVLPGLGPD